MIKFTLPILEQELNDGKLVNTQREMTCFLDISAAAQEVWEREFPVQAKQEGLFDYIERIQKAASDDEKATVPVIISALKAIYCLIRFEKPISKDEFLSLFSFTNLDYFEKLTTRLMEVFQVVYPEERKNF